ncbi:MAG: redoxin domain-containing protein [Candidatus Hydrogenedentes bacterium]|nr:redoxin domain-containing protein [Candidatus Hydrogenedentota bacterium]
MIPYPRFSRLIPTVILALHLCAADSASAGVEPAKVPNFALIDHAGVFHELYRNSDAKGVVLYIAGNGCPIVRQSYPALNALAAKYAEQGVLFLALNPNAADTPAEIAEETREFQVAFPVLVDPSQSVARAFNAVRTAEAILIDPATWTVKYRGAIDDRFDYGAAKEKADRAWLEEALVAHLAGKTIATPATESKGCLIDYASLPQSVSFAKDVAPILQQRCVSCHSKGNIGPFAMNSHKKVSQWAPMMREVIMTRRMPPWDADPDVSAFKNDRALSTAERQTLLAWIDAGAPAGGDKDPLAENAPPEAPVWAMGEPDLIVAMDKELKIPAEGVFDYQYMTVETKLEQDAWVRAVDIVPGNLRALHHCLIFAKFPPEYAHLQPQYDGGFGGYFASYAPGAGKDVNTFPEGTGKFLPAGSKLVLQLHYTATGKEETDLSRVGFYFHKEKPALEISSATAATDDLNIPPYDGNHVRKVKHVLQDDAIFYSMAPHMHLRGKSMKYEAYLPDGSQETLLNVPRFDFNWQNLYVLKEPRHLPKGTEIVVTAAFDNSVKNPYNPDPSLSVGFGEQSFEEMLIAFMDYAYVTPQVYEKREGAVEEEMWMPENAVLPEGLEDSGPAINERTIVSTDWQIGEFKLHFDAGGKLVVNGGIPGAYEMQGNNVLLKVAGQEFYLAIRGSHMFSEGGMLERVQPAPAPQAQK